MVYKSANLCLGFCTAISSDASPATTVIWSEGVVCINILGYTVTFRCTEQLHRASTMFTAMNAHLICNETKWVCSEPEHWTAFACRCEDYQESRSRTHETLFLIQTLLWRRSGSGVRGTEAAVVTLSILWGFVSVKNADLDFWLLNKSGLVVRTLF